MKLSKRVCKLVAEAETLRRVAGAAQLKAQSAWALTVMNGECETWEKPAKAAKEAHDLTMAWAEALYAAMRALQEQLADVPCDEE